MSIQQFSYMIIIEHSELHKTDTINSPMFHDCYLFPHDRDGSDTLT